MPAIQPIPRNTPSSADDEAQALLAVHEKGTRGRRKPQAAQPRQANVSGATAGTKVRD